MGDVIPFKRPASRLGPPSVPLRFRYPAPEDIPAKNKGIVQGDNVHCPLCGKRCLGTRNMGRGSHKYPRFRLVCGDFSCRFEGITHGNHPIAWIYCPYCCQNPRGPDA